jgi:hypothetical protein
MNDFAKLTNLCLRPPLSGGRNYIFAADLLDVLAAVTSAQAPACLRLARLTNEALDLRQGPPQSDDPNFAGTFSHTKNGQDFSWWLTRRPDDVITARSEEKDRALLAGVYLYEDGANAETAVETSLGKAALVLAVLWLEEAYPTLVWSLARLRVEGPFRGNGELRVSRSRFIGRFLQINVWFQGRRWGEFMLASSPYTEQADHD